MITNTFQILEKVKQQKEQSFWDQGVTNWNTFQDKQSIKGVSKEKKSYFDRQIARAKSALYGENTEFFTNLLPSTETWRLYDTFKDQAVFLDIETDGLGSYADITVIGLYNGLETKSMIKNINLDYQALKEELSRYKLIITFNGSSFDLPFIRKRYDVLPNIPHIDLRHCCTKLGHTGGLKNIEKKFGIKRANLVERFSGGDALTLWRMYKATGEKDYLNLLVEYNEEDVINLKKIMNYCYTQLKGELETKIRPQHLYS